MNVCAAKPSDLLGQFAQLYGCSEADFASTLAQLQVAWTAEDGAGEPLGLLGLRPSPAHGAEIMGGVFSAQGREERAVALLSAALAEQPQLYAYADETYWPLTALCNAGLSPVSAYVQRSGPLLGLKAAVPAGLRLLSLSEASDPADRWTA
ncbi:hypothetical protein [Deinococcus radiophilus]|uniref:Uncharacterized protein n=1 Tax=Deinococcus radiophilus TaxID=32062 RepID=A0A431VR15_9DEIO|nr:hypothetical protein [Deinococcus radiophilus]RTR25660.1 hypothetical protein EJ104_10120 [Deinococcus radiophilus]UFA50907.1 hypothetical protein LMT64_03095 [Deinococcus radiophilus]